MYFGAAAGVGFGLVVVLQIIGYPAGTCSCKRFHLEDNVNAFIFGWEYC